MIGFTLFLLSLDSPTLFYYYSDADINIAFINTAKPRHYISVWRLTIKFLCHIIV